MKFVLACCMVVWMAGCSVSSERGSAPDSGRETAAAAMMADAPAATAAVSLFRDDTNIMSNEEMERVLSAKVKLPSDAKVALVRLGQLPRWWGWSEEFVRTSDQLDADFVQRLGSSRRVKQAMYLPALVMPAQVDLPHLRKAAARCQADLMLIYCTSTRTYEKEKFIGDDQTRAYCTVEALLVDTRTGVIPFSTMVTETFSAKRSDRDMDFSETIARAQQQAIGKAWVRLAEQTAAYLDGLPRE